MYLCRLILNKMGKKQPSPGKRAGRKNLPPWEAKQQEGRQERSGGSGKAASGGRKSFGDRDDKRSFGEDKRRSKPRFGDRDDRNERGGDRFDKREGGGRPSRFGNDRGDNRFGGNGGDRRPGRFGDREDRNDRGGDRFERKQGGARPSRFGDRNDRRDDDKRFDRREGGGRPSRFGNDRDDNKFDRKGGDRRPSRFGDRDDRGGQRRDNRFDDRKGGDRPSRFRNDDEGYERQYDGPKGFSGSRPAPKEEQMPLNKYLAHGGISSRREAADIIKEGKVKVNGEVIIEPGYKVKESDKVTMNGKQVKPQKDFVYVLLNKPKDYLTTTDDPEGRRTVMELVRGVEAKRLYPVGRLDRNTTGLLLLTNDGDLAQRLSHPKYRIKKIYQVTLDKDLEKGHFEEIIAGLTLEDGPVKVDAMSYLGSKNEIGIEIHSGRNRIVRRIFEHFNYKVDKLDRVMYAGLTKKNINRGKWRFLSEKEIVVLKHFKS